MNAILYTYTTTHTYTAFSCFAKFRTYLRLPWRTLGIIHYTKCLRIVCWVFWWLWSTQNVMCTSYTKTNIQVILYEEGTCGKVMKVIKVLLLFEKKERTAWKATYVTVMMHEKKLLPKGQRYTMHRPPILLIQKIFSWWL